MYQTSRHNRHLLLTLIVNTLFFSFPDLLLLEVKSLTGILTDYPCFEYDDNIFSCSTCDQYASQGRATEKKFSHFYDCSHGTDFFGTTMPRDFRNSKSALKRHLQSKLHSDADKWKCELEAAKLK